MFEYIRWQILSWRSKYWKKCVTKFWKFTNLYINLACLSVCLGVCLYPINVKTAEPIRPKFCVGPNMALRKVHGQSNFIYVILKYFYLKLFNFVKFWKCAKKFYEIRKLKKKKFILCKEKIKKEIVAKRPKSLVVTNIIVILNFLLDLSLKIFNCFQICIEILKISFLVLTKTLR